MQDTETDWIEMDWIFAQHPELEHDVDDLAMDASTMDSYLDNNDDDDDNDDDGHRTNSFGMPWNKHLKAAERAHAAFADDTR
jgi:hypothetical protein